METTVTLTLAADTTLYEATDPDAQLANGAGSRLFAGANGLGQVRRTLLRADFGQLPSNIQVRGRFRARALARHAETRGGLFFSPSFFLVLVSSLLLAFVFAP